MNKQYANEMYDREYRRARRAARLRKERVRKAKLMIAGLSAALCMVCVFTLSYRSIRTSASSGLKYYTSVSVESGETLWSLADKYIDYNFYKDRNSYISEVKSINHLDDNGFIRAGQTLILPYYSRE